MKANALRMVLEMIEVPPLWVIVTCLCILGMLIAVIKGELRC